MKNNEHDKMTDDKYILMGLDDERSKEVAEVLGNKTCKKIIDYLAETKEASEKDISNALNLPLNTTEYNLGKLVKSGLVEKTKNFFWSVKGKKIPMYKLARKHIIISPSKQPSVHALKAILPIILVALALVALIVFMLPEIKEDIGRTDIPSIIPTLEETKLKQFASYDELKEFVKENYDSRGYYGEADIMKATTTAGAPAASVESAGGADEFSTTNIQVEGVDEADIVKNDGKYIYAVSGNKVVIVNAFPAENMNILSEIDINKSVSEIFINGDKLIVFAQGYEYIPYTEAKCLEYGIQYAHKGGCGGSSEYKSLIYIYDVSDKEAPELENEIEADGNYIDSRMINDYVYVVSTKYIDTENPEPPIYIMNGVETKTAVEDVYYWPYYDTSYVFTSIAAINVENGNMDSKVFLTGATGTIYVSQDNIYLTYQRRMEYKEKFKKQAKEVYLPLLPDEEKAEIEEIMKENKNKPNYEAQQEILEIVKEYSDSLTGEEKAEFDKELLKALEEFEVKIEKENEKTIIHKINVKKDKIEYKGVGEVPGNILNQFSMDEYEGNFRIATTTGNWGGKSLNHLYILDEDLEIIGKVEDLAKGERIYSVRFLGARAYVVTFKQVDPLFVIDVSNPKKPEVLGYLKITGYSDYLHFYDEEHIIGIGKEATEQGRFLGLKISLFDVSDVENPIEKAKIEIGDRGTNSLALSEHKAFLFDKQKNLLVIPIELYEINKEKPQSQWSYGEYVWQGAYVLNINTEEISIRGKITHVEPYVPKYGQAEDEAIGATRNINGQTWKKTGANKWTYSNSREYDWSWTDETIDSQEGGVNYKQYMYDWKFQIKRSLYMDNVLYTISNSKIKANDLESVDEISKVDLPYEGNYYGYAVE